MKLAVLLISLPCLLAASLMTPPLSMSTRLRGGFLADVDVDEDDVADDEESIIEQDIEQDASVGAAAGATRETSQTVPPPRALSRVEIMDKMNAVPVFCILNEDGGVVGMRSADGSDKPAVCWFTDALEARALLEAAQKQSPESKLRLGCHGMGAVFTQCKGWGAVAEGETPVTGFEVAQESTDGEGVDLKLQGPHKLVADTSSQLQELLKAQSLEPGCWQLPVFMCKELQSVKLVPVFLHPSDVSATWIKAGGTEENLPKGLSMMDLRMLVKEMQTDSSPWSLIHFVVNPESVKLAEELRKAQAEAVP